MDNPHDILPRAAGVIEQGMAGKLHIGAQVYVSRDGKTIADFGLGEASAGVPMDTGSMMIRWSSTKPAAAVAIGQLWEQGKLDIEAPVIEYIPEFGAKGKGAVTNGMPDDRRHYQRFSRIATAI